MTKILLLGLGRWGANHLRNLNNLPIELYVAEIGDKQLEPARKLAAFSSGRMVTRVRRP
jgi:predicted dehydrogenase